MNHVEALTAAFAESHPEELSALLPGAQPAAATAIVEVLAPRACARVLRHLPPHSAALLLERVTPAIAAPILIELGVDLAAQCLRAMEDKARTAAVSSMPAAVATAIKRMLAHAPETAGGLMDPLLLTLGERETAAGALDRIREAPGRTMYYVYVLGPGARLRGVVTLRELLRAPADAAVMDMATADPEALSADASPRAVLSHPGWQRYHALPVVDREGRFLGAVRLEALRRTERQLTSAAGKDVAGATAGALAEVFALGAMAVLEWATAPGTRPTQGRSA